jgi:hypothetical protein
MRRIAVACAAAAFLSASPASAGPIFTGTNGELAASVQFDLLAGNILKVVLTNTSLYDQDSNPEVLMAVFWDIAGAPALTYADADITASSSFVHTANLVDPSGTTNDRDVAAEWAYRQASGDLGAGDGSGYVEQSYGLSGAGYGIFGKNDTLRTTHPDRGGSNMPPNGGDFGILSANYVPAGDSNGFENQGPHVKGAIEFRLSGFTGSLDSISNIRFQYGTSLNEPCINCQRVPEPGSLLLLGIGVLATAVVRRVRS